MSVKWYRKFSDAVYEAHFMAAMTRRRYRVSYDAANRWWNLYETNQRIPGELLA